MNALKRMMLSLWKGTKALFRWFMRLSPRGKAITVAIVAIVALIGVVTSEPVTDEDAEPQASVSEPPAEETVQPGQTPDPQPEPEPTTEPASVRPEITDSAITTTEGFYEEETLVDDVTVQVEDDTIVIAMQVNASMNVETARENLDNAARFLAQRAAIDNDGIEGPTADTLGELYDHYTLQVVAGPGGDNTIVSGAKVPSSPVITWS